MSPYKGSLGADPNAIPAAGSTQKVGELVRNSLGAERRWLQRPARFPCTRLGKAWISEVLSVAAFKFAEVFPRYDSIRLPLGPCHGLIINLIEGFEDESAVAVLRVIISDHFLTAGTRF